MGVEAGEGIGKQWGGGGAEKEKRKKRSSPAFSCVSVISDVGRFSNVPCLGSWNKSNLS